MDNMAKDRRILRTYGITDDEYHRRKVAQDSCCYICGEQEMPAGKHRYKLCLDHNHSTGELRKFLCNTCNMLVGMFETCPQRYLNVIQYVQDHQG